MSTHSRFLSFAACISGLALISPAPPVGAAPPAAQKAVLGADIVFVKGTLTGKLLNANGEPVDGAVVTVTQAGKTVGQTVTAAD